MSSDNVLNFGFFRAERKSFRYEERTFDIPKSFINAGPLSIYKHVVVKGLTVPDRYRYLWITLLLSLEESPTARSYVLKEFLLQARRLAKDCKQPAKSTEIRLSDVVQFFNALSSTVCQFIQTNKKSLSVSFFSSATFNETTVALEINIAIKPLLVAVSYLSNSETLRCILNKHIGAFELYLHLDVLSQEGYVSSKSIEQRFLLKPKQPKSLLMALNKLGLVEFETVRKGGSSSFVILKRYRYYSSEAIVLDTFRYFDEVF